MKMLLVLIALLVCSGIAEEFGCVQYPATPHSSHNKWNVFVVYPRKYADKVIVDINIVRRNFYRCEVIKDGIQTLFYGTNGTHYWVEKGCGGDFLITECPAPGENPVSATGATPFSNPESSGDIMGLSDLFQHVTAAFQKLKSQWQQMSSSEI